MILFLKTLIYTRLWNETSHTVYNGITSYHNNGTSKYKQLTTKESKKCTKNKLMESIRDIAWLISVGRLPVRYPVKWSYNIYSTECPMHNCQHIESLILKCSR